MIKETRCDVWCTTSFVAFHAWKDAPEIYKHLSVPHRHRFEVLVGVRVHHDNRDVEFQYLKKVVDSFLVMTYEMYSSYWTYTGDSCETMAQKIADHIDGCGYKVSFVEVSEDGENGAYKSYE